MTALTIITPTYNGARFLAATINSILRQLGPDDHYIVVDDGSTDGSAAILAGFEDRLTVYRQANLGEAAAVNAGVAQARTDIVGIVNADDPILPGLLAAVRAAFAGSDLSGVYPDWSMIDDRGAELRRVETREFSQQALFCEHLCIPGPGAFFRRSVMAGALIRDDRAYGMTDYDFWLRFSLQSKRIARLPKVLATWRAHDQGSTFVLPGAKLARAKVDTILRVFEGKAPEDVRSWRRQALSAAYYNAALVGMRWSSVPAFWYALKSYALKAVWPRSIAEPGRRSLVRLAYASLQPLSGAVHALVSPAIPKRFRRQAIIMQRFGLRTQPVAKI